MCTSHSFLPVLKTRSLCLIEYWTEIHFLPRQKRSCVFRVASLLVYIFFEMVISRNTSAKVGSFR